MTFDAQPTLRGQLVELRPLRPDDYAALYAVAADRLIWEQHPAKNRHEAHVFQQFFDDAMHSAGALVVIDRETRQVVGSSRFHLPGRGGGEVEIGWTFLARSYWGGRYNGEMKRLMLGHAFQFVDRVVFLVGVENTRSQRAVERIGAIRVGVRLDDGGNESYLYQITPSRVASPGTGHTL